MVHPQSRSFPAPAVAVSVAPDLDGLLEKARASTESEDGRWYTAEELVEDDYPPEDAVFMAACRPAVIVPLIERVQRAEALADSLDNLCTRWREECERTSGKLREARSQLRHRPEEERGEGGACHSAWKRGEPCPHGIRATPSPTTSTTEKSDA